MLRPNPSMVHTVPVKALCPKRSQAVLNWPRLPNSLLTLLCSTLTVVSCHAIIGMNCGNNEQGYARRATDISKLLAVFLRQLHSDKTVISRRLGRSAV